MLAKTRHTLQSIFRGGWAARAARPPLLSAAEQTRATWARRVESYEAIPLAYQAFFAPLQAAGRDFPYTILTPTVPEFLRRRDEKLVCDLEGEIVVLEGRGEACEIVCYPLEGISYVEVRAVLLDSHFRVGGLNAHSQPAISTVSYNTVTDYLYAPLLERARLAGKWPRGEGQSAEADKFNYWTHTSYKFMNYARHSLLGDERVLQAILQPEIRAPRFRPLGRLWMRKLAPTLACILTDRELILIREEQRRDGKDRYGGVWDYIRLDKIVNLSLSEKGGDLLALIVELPGDVRFECLFQADAKREVEQLLAQYRQFTLQ